MLTLTTMFQTGGYPRSTWRQPGSRAEEVLSFPYYRELALNAENAGIDAVFMADQLDMEADSWDDLNQPLEPFTLLSGIAAVTSRIGLIASANTTYSHPYSLARQLASLDHVSTGRAGWNIVTGGSGAASHNFGFDEHPGHEQRYARAREFVEVAQRLWTSWPPEATVADVDGGVLTDRSRLLPIAHHGEFFDVEGPLNVPQPPQGWPLLVQAGQSPTGIATAAQHADLLFAVEHDRTRAVALRERVRAATVAAGRPAGALRVILGLIPNIGDPEVTAARRRRNLELGSHDLLLAELDSYFPFDFAGLPDDAEIDPASAPHPTSLQGIQSSYANIWQGLQDGVTRKGEIVERFTQSGRWGFLTVDGRPEEVADVVEDWYVRGAADGFNITPGFSPRGAVDFLEQVVPILVRRGLYEAHEPGPDLRTRLGLPAGVRQTLDRHTPDAAEHTTTTSSEQGGTR